MQRPLSAALGTDRRNVFDTGGGQTEIGLNVTLLIDIDPPSHLFIKTKGNKSTKGKSRPDMGLHAALQSVLQRRYSRREAFSVFLLFNLVKFSSDRPSPTGDAVLHDLLDLTVFGWAFPAAEGT